MGVPYSLPESAVLDGDEFAIRSDFRSALDILQVMADPELEPGEKAAMGFEILYPDAERLEERHLQDAADYLAWFIDGGRAHSPSANRARLMDWGQDFPLIAAPVNRVLGFDVRGSEDLHWWTFLGAYMEVGDSLFAQVVSIRDKRARGERLDKGDARFYRENRGLVDLAAREATPEEEAVLDEWIRAGS